MRKGYSILVLMLVLLFCVQPAQPVHATEITKTDEGQKQIYNISITFHKNGGKGSMATMPVRSESLAYLTKNRFTRKSYFFNGWNTRPNGKGTAYKNKAEVSQLANASTNGQNIVLYAQWKLGKTSISKISSTPVSITVNYKKNTKAAGYRIEYSTTKNFDEVIAVSASKKATSKVIKKIKPGMSYYVRMQNYYKRGSTKIYSDYSATKKIKVKSLPTIANTNSWGTIEADVTLTGSGTGYHAKLVMVTPTSAVSFGLQYDAHAVAPYTGHTMALIENVAHNGTGGQVYTRPSNKYLKLGQTYHLMMTVDKKGNGAVYLDYEKIGTFYNPNLISSDYAMRVEGSGRINGDSVTATFKNIKLKQGNKYEFDKEWRTYEFKTNPTINSTVKKDGTVNISGYVSGLGGGEDWDSAYERVSNIRQFVY